MSGGAKKWLLGCGCATVLIATALTALIFTGWNTVQDNIANYSNDSAEQIFGPTVTADYKHEGFVVPGLGGYAILTDDEDEKVFIAYDNLLEPHELRKLNAARPSGAIDILTDYLIEDAEDGSLKRVEFLDDREMTIGDGTQPIRTFRVFGKTSEGIAFYAPLIATVLQYPKQRHVFLIYLNYEHMILPDENGNTEPPHFADALDIMEVELTALMNDSPLITALKVNSL